jgi:hypothetical protein
MKMLSKTFLSHTYASSLGWAVRSPKIQATASSARWMNKGARK